MKGDDKIAVAARACAVVLFQAAVYGDDAVGEMLSGALVKIFGQDVVERAVAIVARGAESAAPGFDAMKAMREAGKRDSSVAASAARVANWIKGD